MTDQRRQTELEVWTALLTGRVTDREEAALTELADADPQFADDLRADARIHRLLDALGQVPREDESFVAGVLSRCAIVESNRSSDEDEPEVWFAEASPSGVVPDETEVSPIEGQLPDADASGSDLLAPDRTPPVKIAHRRAARKPVRDIVVVLVVFAAGILTGVFWRGDQSDPAIDNGVSGGLAENEDLTSEKRTVSDERSALPHPKTGLASLRNVGDGEWATPRVENERLSAGPLRLLRGRGEILFDDGAVVTLEGPAEVRLLTDREVVLDRGQLASLRPTGARPVRIATPVSRVTEGGSLDQDGRYLVAVDETGATDLEVFSGEVDVEPLASGTARPAHWTLSRERLNRASFIRSNPKTGQRSVLGSARSTGGVFEGVVSLDGEPLTFDSESAFNTVLNDATAKFRRQPDSLVRDWPLLRQTMTGVLQQGGSINLNGQPAGIQDILNLMPLQPADENKETRQPGSFQGTINVNGETQTFSTRKEFDAAVRDLFPQGTLPPFTTPSPTIPNGVSKPAELDKPEPKPVEKPDGPVNPFLPDTDDA